MKKQYDIITERTHLMNPSMNIVVKGSIVGVFQQNRFEDSICELRKIHPLLNCVIKQKSGAYFFEPTFEKKIHIHYEAKKTKSQWLDAVKEENKTPFKFGCDIMLRCYVYVEDNTFDVVFIAHHILGDAMSFIYLFQDFLDVYCGEIRTLKERESNLISGTCDLPEASKLSLGLQMILHNINDRWKQAYQNNEFSQEDYEQMYQNFQNKNAIRFLVGRVRKEDLAILKEKCHKYQVSINSAIIASYLYASRRREQKKGVKKKITIPVNHREHLKIQPKQCIGNYVSGVSISFCYNHKKSFWENVKEIDFSTKKVLKNNKKSLQILQLFCMLEGSIFDAMYFSSYGTYYNKIISITKKIFPFKQREEGVDVSNLGVVSIRTNYEAYQVKDFVYLPPVAIVFDETIGVITVNDEMVLGLSYKSNSMPEKNTKRLLQYMLYVLKHV